MASLLSSSDISSATGSIGSLFDTFSRDIVIHKESIKTLLSSTNAIIGYGDNQPNAQYSFTPVNATFPAVVRFTNLNSNGENFIKGVDARNKDTEVMIKVKTDAMNYIRVGTTEKITIGDRNFNIIEGARFKPYLTLDFYYFELKEIV